MEQWFRPWPITILILVTLIILFSFWYRRNEPLSENEIDQFLQYVETLEEPTQAFIKQNNVRQFLDDDDGKAFYVVNLFKFTETTGPDNFNQFTRSIVPLWLRHGTHPVFSSSRVLSGSNSWDRLAIVRYRSRRDWVDIVRNNTLVEALPLRFKATENNLRLVVNGISIPNLLLLLVLAISLGLSITLILGKWSVKQR